MEIRREKITDRAALTIRRRAGDCNAQSPPPDPMLAVVSFRSDKPDAFAQYRDARPMQALLTASPAVRYMRALDTPQRFYFVIDSCIAHPSYAPTSFLMDAGCWADRSEHPSASLC